jgi:DhnA family fructose-bisphosphate aldolase class Ia
MMAAPVLASDGKAVVVAMDHARAYGAIEGLESPGAVIDAAVEAEADAVMTTLGVVKHYRERLIGPIPTILRLDGGPSFYREDWLAYTEWSLLHSVEDALLLGVDGVVLMAFVGIPVELQTYRIVARVAGECMRANLPLMVEALPSPSERIPDPKAPDAMASAARLAFEHGADLVKSYYTEDFRRVTDSCPVPVLIAGGPRGNPGGDAAGRPRRRGRRCCGRRLRPQHLAERRHARCDPGPQGHHPRRPPGRRRAKRVRSRVARWIIPAREEVAHRTRCPDGQPRWQLTRRSTGGQTCTAQDIFASRF